jgi:hypothetical protein
MRLFLTALALLAITSSTSQAAGMERTLPKRHAQSHPIGWYRAGRSIPGVSSALRRSSAPTRSFPISVKAVRPDVVGATINPSRGYGPRGGHLQPSIYS